MELNRLAVPAVYVLIAFLGYPSQILFLYLEPAPLTKNELILSNVLLVLIFITYTRSVYVDPGTIPKEALKEHGVSSEGAKDGKSGGQRTKWCRKCDAVKPPRAHHCKECKRFVLSARYVLIFFFFSIYAHPNAPSFHISYIHFVFPTNADLYTYKKKKAPLVTKTLSRKKKPSSPKTTDAFPKWTTTAPGRQTASRTRPSRTSYASSSTQP